MAVVVHRLVLIGGLALLGAIIGGIAGAADGMSQFKRAAAAIRARDPEQEGDRAVALSYLTQGLFNGTRIGVLGGLVGAVVILGIRMRPRLRLRRVPAA